MTEGHLIRVYPFHPWFIIHKKVFLAKSAKYAKNISNSSLEALISVFSDFSVVKLEIYFVQLLRSDK